MQHIVLTTKHIFHVYFCTGKIHSVVHTDRVRIIAKNIISLLPERTILARVSSFSAHFLLIKYRFWLISYYFLFRSLCVCVLSVCLSLANCSRMSVLFICKSHVAISNVISFTRSRIASAHAATLVAIGQIIINIAQSIENSAFNYNTLPVHRLTENSNAPYFPSGFSLGARDHMRCERLHCVVVCIFTIK